jgi:TonB family protein
VFNMDSDSFANNGSFAMPAGPGNTRFGPIGKLRNPNARPERPPGVPGGTGTAAFAPAPPTRVARGARVVREVRAPYPEQARDAGIEGVVLLQVEVTRTGTIHSVRVLTDPGYGLGAAAARALRSFRFAPAVDGGGAPIDSRFTYTYRFELDDF